MHILLNFLTLLLVAATCAHAADTRGLQVIAKDSATSQQGEVKLYNKSYAVIIGIDKYPNLPPSRQLSYAVRDAQGVEEVLKKYYLFDKIVTLRDEEATKERIMRLLTSELPKEMGKEDALFIFWAGHGNQEKSDYGDLGYLIPFDGTTEEIYRNITMTDIRDTISKKLPAKHVFYAMDACYSGLLVTRGMDGKSRRDLSYLKEITKESSRQILTAGGKGEEALDGGPGGHSVFTGRLIEALAGAKDFITANELQAVIREKVYSDARARNHTQTPGFGLLYGVGDFVFILKQQDRLGDLKGESLARQNELDRLRKMEQEAEAAKEKEQAEIAKKESELADLDKRIAEMKERLGSGAARSTDSLDQIIVLAEQKEQQGERLEELRRQREAEEQQRLQEIVRLKEEAAEKRRQQVLADLAKFQKVAESKYAKDMKGAAWNALIANYPEAKELSLGDEKGFLELHGYDEKVGQLYTDPDTGLQWVRDGNLAGKTMTWQEAMTWVEQLEYAGYHDWRLPKKEELATFAKKGGNRPSEFFNACGFSKVEPSWYWSPTSCTADSTDAWVVDMWDGAVDYDNKSFSYFVWPVRAGR